MTTALRQPLSNLQLELLEMFTQQVTNEDLLAIKKMLSDYFAKKAIDEADKLWDERAYTQDTMNEWLETHMRTPYKNSAL
jgi:hypothetical protein